MTPTWIQAVVLGIVQGLTEFVPVSSSGHLVLAPYLLGWERPGLAFDVALHVGTLGAILAYFRRELWAMARGLVGALLRRAVSAEDALYRRLALLLAVGTIPVAIAGYAAKPLFEDVFENPLAASAFLLVTAALLVTGERVRDRRVRAAEQVRVAERQHPSRTGDWRSDRPPPEPGSDARAVRLPTGDDPADRTGQTLQGIGLRHAVAVGLFQVLALFPGVSRSGATITGGVVSGLTRESATRFSFLLALPALVGAAALSLGDLAEPLVYSWLEILGGVVAAFVSGYLAIRYLVALVSRDRLTGFAKYVVVAAAIGFAGYAVIGPPA
jgi:undecaprenyl-diphosphatase